MKCTRHKKSTKIYLKYIYDKSDISLQHVYELIYGVPMVNT